MCEDIISYERGYFMSFRDCLLDSDRVYICDGAMGTMLHALGIPLSRCFDEINLSQPEIVERIHRAYLDAGAEVIETNTFGANRLKLEGYGLGQQARQINLAAVDIARRVVSGRALVAGSVGPTGKLMHPFGPLDFDTAVDAYIEQVSALCDAGIDLLIVETMQDLREAKAAILAAQQVGNVPIVAQMSFGQEGKSMMGTPPDVAAVVLGALRINLVGTNCGTGPQDMLSTLQRMASVTTMGLSAQPNAGLPTLHEGRLIYLSTPEYVANLSRQFVKNGAVLVGGCCGTTPDHIKAIAESVAGMRPVMHTAEKITRLASRTKLLEVRSGRLLLMSGKPGLAQLSCADTVTSLQTVVAQQYESGAHIICLDLDSVSVKPKQAVESVQSMCGASLCLASCDLSKLEEGLRAAEGRPMIVFRNSDLLGGREIYDLAKRYGALLVIDASNPAASPQEVFGICESFAATAEEAGISRMDVLSYVGELFENSKASERVLQSLQLLTSALGINTIASVGHEVDEVAARVVRDAVDMGLGLLLTNVSPRTVRSLEDVNVLNQSG